MNGPARVPSPQDAINDMTIQIAIKNVYGKEAIYPANETAQLFARIAGTKTLKRETIQLAERLGYTILVTF